jgi:hypothetical protein
MTTVGHNRSKRKRVTSTASLPISSSSWPFDPLPFRPTPTRLPVPERADQRRGMGLTDQGLIRPGTPTSDSPVHDARGKLPSQVRSNATKKAPIPTKTAPCPTSENSAKTAKS